MATIKVTTVAGSNASMVGERYGAFDGVAWRNSIDCCDSDGGGRVFLDCQDEAVADYVRKQMSDDDEVVSHD